MEFLRSQTQANPVDLELVDTGEEAVINNDNGDSSSGSQLKQSDECISSGATSRSSGTKSRQPAHYKQFLTCNFPRRMHVERDLTRFKYEINVSYRDSRNNIRRKRIKFGSQFVNDLRDKGSTKISLKKKFIQYRKKLGKYLIDNGEHFNINKCQDEQWPLQKNFWAANYLWGIDTTAQQENEDRYTPLRLEHIVEKLQELPTSDLCKSMDEGEHTSQMRQ